MGTNYNGEEPENGVIPKVMDTIFSRVETMKDSTEYLIRVSFIEVLSLEHEDFISGFSECFIFKLVIHKS